MKNIFKLAGRYLKRNGSHVLIGLGIFGSMSAVGLAILDTKAAVNKVEEKKKELGTDKLTVRETAAAVWKCYIPSALTLATSTTCIVLGDNENAKKNMALATMYSISETAAREYQNKVIKTIGEKKEAIVRDAIAKDHIEEKPVSKTQVIVTGKGESLCFDDFSRRYFKSNINTIDRAVNQLNYQMINEMSVCLNDFYYAIGLEPIRNGDDTGWNVNRGLVTINYSSQITDEGTPCIVVNFGTVPKYDYLNY